MDSCVTAAFAARHYECAFLHLNYGQRTEQRELRAFRDLASHFAVTSSLAVSMEHLAAIGGSSLTDRTMDVPRADLHAEGIPTSYVPFRNANLLAVAVSWAEVLGAEAVFIGAVEEDSSGYPDCRRSFYDAYNAVIREGTKPETHIRIITPLIDMTKVEIVRKGIELKAPLHLTWSCYKREDIACGECRQLRAAPARFSECGSRRPHSLCCPT